jgi:hypothetical protein
MADPHVWVGLKACGCCVAVVVEDAPKFADPRSHRKDVEKTKREFLRDGLSVVRASWQEWQERYLPSLQRDCAHPERRA